MRYTLALFVFLGCAQAFRAANPTVLIFPDSLYVRNEAGEYNLLHDMQDSQARTACSYNNQPFIILSPKVMGTIYEKFTLTHELVHVRQLSQDGDCRATMARYRDDQEFKFKMELEAYCVQFAEQVRYGFDHTAMVAWLRIDMAARYGFDSRKVFCVAPLDTLPWR